MSSQTAATKLKESASPTTTSGSILIHKGEGPAFDRVNEAVSRRAYQLYEQAGREGGNDNFHWYRAESEVLKALPEIRESASWFTVNCPLPGFHAHQICVGMNANRALIVAEQTSGTLPSGVHSDEQVASVCFVANWPSEVDPATASAYLKNDTLTVTVKRAELAS